MSELRTPSSGLGLRLDGLAKSFGAKAVLRGVVLTLGQSEFVAVVGESGCGKSTLLRLVAGLDQPSAGAIWLDDQPLSGANPRVRVVFQDHRLLPWKRALDNVAFGLGSEWHPAAQALLAQVGLADHAHELPGTLSGGEKQRVSLARALLARPGLLLLDEPLGALDALTRIGMQGLIERLWQEQAFTALLITHDVDEAIVLADRVVVLKDGVVDFEIEVPLPRPRPRTGAEFDRIKALVLDRILRINEGVTCHAHRTNGFTSEPSSPRAPAPAPSARGATPRPSSSASSTLSTISMSPARSSGASST